MRKVVVVLGILLGLPVWAYKYHPYRWRDFPVVWYLDRHGYPLSDLTLKELQAALEQAFSAWEHACYGGKCTRVRFKFGGYVDALGAQFDGKNVVSFAPPGIYDSMPGVSETPGSLGKTVVVYDSQGYLKEADIVFPVTQTKILSVNPTKSQYDLIGIAMHQIGHMLGIDHSDVPQATMYGVWPPAGDTSWRTLEEDDIKAVVDLYPAQGEPVQGDAEDATDAAGWGSMGGGSASKEKWGCDTGGGGLSVGLMLLMGLMFVVLGRIRREGT